MDLMQIHLCKMEIIYFLSEFLIFRYKSYLLKTNLSIVIGYLLSGKIY